jgi:hypothetical protein
MFAVLFLSLFIFMSCGKDDDSSDPDNPPIVNPDTPVPDPEGTITVNIDGSSSTEILIDGFPLCDINWDEPDNFKLYAYYSKHYVSICNLGAMKGLGNITSIPSTGFTNSTVACEAGHGYVVKFEERMYSIDGGDLIYGEVIKVVYIRLYVVEPIVSTLGGIMGAKVKYQYPFEPAN